MRSVNAPQRMRDDRLTAGELEQMHILAGGDPFANGPAVNPGVLGAATSLGQMNEDLARIPDAIEGTSRARALDRVAAKSADGADVCQSHMAVAFRPGDRRQPEQLWGDRQEADAPGAARLARGHLD